jgi:hypothetical protein
MKNEEFCSQLSTNFKRHVGFRNKKDLGNRTFRLLRTAGETETMQEDIQDCVELGEGDPGFQLLTEEEIAAVIFFYLFSSALHVLLNFSIYLFSEFFFCLLGVYFASLIWIIT